ncbi:hypothetical protein P4O66_010571 [Electrophorus voltai]|uniref:Uncharacterized protein n=1 Tax=Electrophorus voltai TaxID=2609070 RepID=A0AAD8ZCU1_9TELE|nr:hypothetical protein P4O66_010571 [Electrophorus voltai]
MSNHFCFPQYVLSVLKFTYPTLFLGSVAVSWLPGSVLFLGNIYAGSKALSILPIPFFFVLQNVSEVVFFFIVRLTLREVSIYVAHVTSCISTIKCKTRTLKKGSNLAA